jgi:hypothetical protein
MKRAIGAVGGAAIITALLAVAMGSCFHEPRRTGDAREHY